MYMTCTYRLDGAGYSYTHMYLPNVQDMSIQYLEDYRPCHHHEIYTYRYFYRIQYLIHHATSIAMTSYHLALASTSIGDRSVSFSPRGRISPYMY